MSLNKLITQLSLEPYKIGKDLSIEELVHVMKISCEKYYNTNNPIFSDEVYDILNELLQERDPENPFHKQVGAPVYGKKTRLPYYMGSIDKIKPNTSEVSKWIKKYNGPYVISDKLDGSSGLLYYRKDKTQWKTQMFTRGSHDFGRDITHLITPLLGEKYLVGPPIEIISELEKQGFSDIDKIAVRGEIIMSRVNFVKYQEIKKDSRSLVNGLVCQKQVDKKLAKEVDFVSFEIVEPRLSKINQFNILKSSGFKTPDFKMYELVSNDDLSVILKDRRNNSIYDIDGVIIEDNGPFEHNETKSPEFAFAFKMVLNENVAEVKVLEVIWEASKHGVLVPKVNYQPVTIKGVTLKNATGFNARYIIDNVIGPGAIIKITRSGDVIPHILEVIKPAKEPSMPKASYSWNATNVDIMLENMDEDEGVYIKRLINFFTRMNIANISNGMIIKFMNSSAPLKTLKDILNATPEVFIQVDGIKDKMAKKLYDNIQSALINPKKEVVMAASNIFGNGFGERKLKPIVTNVPNFMDESLSPSDLKELVINIEGFHEKTASQFVSNLPKFKQFIKEHDMIPFELNQPESSSQSLLPQSLPTQEQVLSHEVIVMTGFRSQSLKDIIIDSGGELADNITKKTTILITKEPNSTSTKVKKAEKQGIKVMSANEFQEYYNSIVDKME